MGKPGPKIGYDRFDLIKTLKEYIEFIQVDNNITPPSSDIWEIIKNDKNLKLTPKAVYQFARNNRSEIFSTKVNPEDTQHNSSNETFQSSDFDIEEVDSSINTSKDDEKISRRTKFSVILSYDKWLKMEPIEKRYKRKLEKCRAKNERVYKVLEPGVWTNIISEEIWQKKKLACNWSFKRGKVFSKSDIYAKMSGKCSTCEATITGFIKNEPKHGSLVRITFVAKNIRDDLHNGAEKRRMNGALAKKYFGSRKTALHQRNKMACEDMELFENEPPHMPSLNAIRCGKARTRQLEKISADPVTSLGFMKYLPDYKNCIHAIGLDPIFVHYWSSEQLRIFDVYSKKNKRTKICCDASGGFVNQIKRPDETFSKKMFLYALVIESAIPISMMISERHDSNAIYFWLTEWLRSGGKTPCEFVSDMSDALLNAAVRAFARLPSTKDYNNVCFNLLRNPAIKAPDCYIRIDLAHFMKCISEWNCVKTKPQKVKDFFMRCVGLLVMATDITSMENYIKAIFIVAMSKTEGKHFHLIQTIIILSSKKISFKQYLFVSY